MSAVSDFPNLETTRLRLREITPDDSPTLFAIHSDVNAMRWFGTDPMNEPAEADKLVETFASWRQMPNPGTRWGIALKSDGMLIGTCGLFKWNRGWKSCAIGYELHRPLWGQGIMREALRASLGWGFESMKLNRVEAQVHPENLPSLKLLAALGFVREGVLRQAGFWLGEYRDLIQLSLLEADFRPH